MTANYKYPVSRKKLRKGHVYPVRVEDLIAKLDEYQLNSISNICYVLRTSKRVILSARYFGENRITQKGKIEIWLFSAEPEEADAVHQLLLAQAIPLIAEWVQQADKQDKYWRQKDHNIVCRYFNGYFEVSKDQDHWF